VKMFARYLAFTVLAAAVLACGTVSTAVPGGTPGASAPPPRWLAKAKTICLEVKQTFVQLPTQQEELIRDPAARALTGLGLQVVEPGGTCDATLTLDLGFEALGASYTPQLGGLPEFCWTGAKVTGSATLAAPEQKPVTWPIAIEQEPRSGVVIPECTIQSEAPFGDVVRKAMLKALALAWGPPGPGQALADPDPQVRDWAAWTLGTMGRAAASQAPALAALLNDTEGGPRASALWALVRMGLDAKPALAGLLPLLRERPDPGADYERKMAVDVLRAIGPDAAEAVPALITLLQDPDGQVRFAAAQALGTVGAGSPDAVSALIALLESDEENMRSAAAESLGAIGPKAIDAVPALIRSMEKYPADAWRNTGPALRKITGQNLADDPAKWRAWWEKR